MSKFKYAIPTDKGTITRTSTNGGYTHIVVSSTNRCEASLRREYAEAIKKAASANEYEHNWAKTTLEQFPTVEAYIANNGYWLKMEQKVQGFCSRRDLAEKLAGKWVGYFENVQIIEIKPEHVTEVKSRPRKKARTADGAEDLGVVSKW